jgi:hypothetical protein
MHATPCRTSWSYARLAVGKAPALFGRTVFASLLDRSTADRGRRSPLLVPLSARTLITNLPLPSSLSSVARFESPRRFAPVVRLAVRATPSLSHKTPSCLAQGFASLCSTAPSYGDYSCKAPALGSCTTSSTCKGHRHKDSLFAGLGIRLYLMVLASYIALTISAHASPEYMRPTVWAGVCAFSV